MYRLCVILMLLLGIAISVPNAARADFARDYAYKLMQDYEREVCSAQSQLSGSAPESWSQEDMERYLFNALYAVNYALIVYILDNGRHPYVIEDLADSGILDSWPGNPFRDWEPMSMLSTTDDFSAGDLVLQICPPSEYSGYNPTAKTYCLAIYGPAIDYESLNPEQLTPVFSWSTVPMGSVYVTGAWWEKSEKTRAKIDAARKAREEREQQEQQEQSE